MARLNSNGTADTTFNAVNADNKVYSIVVQINGKILVGGIFTTIGNQTRNKIAQLNADGTADTFNPNPNGNVYAIAVPVDGKILVAGYFNTIDGQSRNNITRLCADEAALQKLTVSTDGTTINWARSQSSPEVHGVIFEGSADKSTWTVLGTATRISGGWQLAGQHLPAMQNRYVRAVGKAYGAQGNGSTSSIESVRKYYLDYIPAPIDKFPWPMFLPAITKGIR